MAGVTGIGLLSTVVVTPAVIGLEITSFVFSVFSVTSKFLSRKFLLKAKKHNEIKNLAESKLNSVIEHISNTINDNYISEKDFSLIISIVKKYEKMKEEIKIEKQSMPTEYLLDYFKEKLNR